ncbi:accessory gene regulator B family protein [Brevibacillus dissolubilis]|uniref:accessory gene regulator B family protein n=1 Tax=Brevibacillus dissolubilis TaxID=1844116 RepID=UPI001117A655|nr:accessory gene regulator B family protein [Brevibacillus dissolubilis]
MSKLEQFSTSIAKGLVKHGSTESVRTISHGLEIMILQGLNLGFILLLAYISNSFISVLITTLIYFLLRSFSGGLHLSQAWTCLIIGNLLLLGMGYGASVIELPHWSYEMLFLVVAYSYAMVLNLRYAPQSRVFTFPLEQRQKNRRILTVLLTVGLLFSLVMIANGFERLAFSYAFAIILQSTYLHPASFWFFRQVKLA